MNIIIIIIILIVLHIPLYIIQQYQNSSTSNASYINL